MFRTRLLSGIVLVIIELLLIIPGGDILLAGSLIISLIGMYELYRVFKFKIRIYSGYDDVCIGKFDYPYVYLCVYISQI